MDQLNIQFLGSSANDMPLFNIYLRSGEASHQHLAEMQEATDFFDRLRQSMRNQIPPTCETGLPNDVRQRLEYMIKQELQKRRWTNKSDGND